MSQPQPAIYQIQRKALIQPANLPPGAMAMEPVGMAFDIEGAHAAAKALNLTAYQIVLQVTVFSNVVVDTGPLSSILNLGSEERN